MVHIEAEIVMLLERCSGSYRSGDSYASKERKWFKLQNRNDRWICFFELVLQEDPYKSGNCYASKPQNTWFSTKRGEYGLKSISLGGCGQGLGLNPYNFATELIQLLILHF